jgi:hypothetical protein
MPAHHDIPVLDISVAAGANLSAKQYFFVKPDGTLCGAGGKALGVLQNNPTSGQAAGVRVLGCTKVVYGGSISVGDYVASDANGKAVLATVASVLAGTPEPLAGDHVIGIALTAGSASDVGSIALIHAGLTN